MAIATSKNERRGDALSIATTIVALVTLLLLSYEAAHQELLPVFRLWEPVAAIARCASRDPIHLPLIGATPPSLRSPWFRVVTVPLGRVSKSCGLEITASGLLHYNARRHYVKLLPNDKPTDIQEDSLGVLMPKQHYYYHDNTLIIPLNLLAEHDLDNQKIEILIASSLRERAIFFAGIFGAFVQRYWWLMISFMIVLLLGIDRYRTLAARENP